MLEQTIHSIHKDFYVIQKKLLKKSYTKRLLQDIYTKHTHRTLRAKLRLSSPSGVGGAAATFKKICCIISKITWYWTADIFRKRNVAEKKGIKKDRLIHKLCRHIYIYIYIHVCVCVLKESYVVVRTSSKVVTDTP